jgi:CheY-like chemotaxis protein
MGRTVLIVDPSDDLRRRTRQLLETHGWEVLEAADGIVAWAVACRNRPDLITIRRPNSVYGARALFDSMRANVEMEDVPVVIVDPDGEHGEDRQESVTVLQRVDVLDAPEEFMRLIGEILDGVGSPDAEPPSAEIPAG